MITALSVARWVDFAAAMLAQQATAWPAEQVACHLADTFEGVGCGYHIRVSDGAAQGLWPPERFVNHLDEILRWSQREAVSDHPILRYYLATCDVRPVQVDDVPSHIATPRLVAAWTERGRRWGGVQSQLALPLTVNPTRQNGFVIGREDPFTTQEMDLARSVDRLLLALDSHLAAFYPYATRAADTCVSEVADDVQLTPRQLAVLGLLAEGFTAAAIGRRLMIAERTVHKHLERSYAKLGVNDRLSAVSRAQRIGLLPNPFASSQS